MRAKIISSRVRHTVSFAPNPENPAFGTKPAFVMNRVVSRLENIPPGIKHLYFRDVVVSVALVDNKEITLESESFNEEHHHVVWTLLEARRHGARGYDVQVAVPPHLEGQVWVFEPKSSAEKRATEATKLGPEKARRALAEDIAEEVLAMSDEETRDYIEKHNLGHLIAPGRLEALLAKALGNPQEVAKLIVVWDRDKDEPETEH